MEKSIEELGMGVAFMLRGDYIEAIDVLRGGIQSLLEVAREQESEEAEWVDQSDHCFTLQSFPLHQSDEGHLLFNKVFLVTGPTASATRGPLTTMCALGLYNLALCHNSLALLHGKGYQFQRALHLYAVAVETIEKLDFHASNPLTVIYLASLANMSSIHSLHCENQRLEASLFRFKRAYEWSHSACDVAAREHDEELGMMLWVFLNSSECHAAVA